MNTTATPRARQRLMLRGSLRRAVTVGAFAMVMMSGCGTSGSVDVAVETPQSTAVAVPDPRIPGLPSAAYDVAADQAGSASGADATSVHGAFEQALAVFCTNTSSAQRQASLAKPTVVPADVQDFARTVGASWTTETEKLSRSTPPAELADTFAQFLDIGRAMAAANAALVEDPDDEAAGAAIDELFASRRPIAERLGARRCDGKLPAVQQDAVVAATRAFITTADPAQACGSLVTTTFVATQFFKTPDPAAACTDEALRRVDPALRADDITTSKVTGTEGISATIEFEEVCGCNPGIPLSARLYFVEGRWLVESVRVLEG